MSHQFVTAPLQVVSFWLSVALPILYVPLLFEGSSGKLFTLFAGLVALHVLTLFLGRNYHREKA
ncbi:hypothetical protein [Haladaptatus sp. NG-SE-30]